MKYRPSQRPRVLIVDPSEDTRDVLHWALARRDVEVFSAAGADGAVAIAARQRPQVIVLDVDLAPGEVEPLCRRFETPHGPPPTLLLLGRLPRVESPAQADGDAAQSADHERRDSVTKPYHFGDLIRKIEEWINRAAG